jgi:uncharacterized protein YdeI (YjbR/CyaY-like superfamily)
VDRAERRITSFPSADAWEKWLIENQDDPAGLWLKIAKKDSGVASVSYQEALDVALCYGWIDGQKDSFDVEFWLQRFTRRRPKSKWSKINCGKAESLIAAGRMKPSGLREVERAKADGRWEAAYDGQRTASVPDDLQRELDMNPEAHGFFGSLDSGNRYAILYRIQEAKKPETRAQRIQKYVTMLNRHEKIHP